MFEVSQVVAVKVELDDDVMMIAAAAVVVEVESERQ